MPGTSDHRQGPLRLAIHQAERRQRHLLTLFAIRHQPPSAPSSIPVFETHPTAPTHWTTLTRWQGQSHRFGNTGLYLVLLKDNCSDNNNKKKFFPTVGDASYLFICFFFGLFSSIRSSIIHFDLNNVRMKKTLRFTDNHIFALLLSLIFFWLHLVPVASDGIDADAATLAAATCTRDESPRPHRQRQVFFSINVWIFFSFSKTSFESNFKRITTLPDETFGKKDNSNQSQTNMEDADIIQILSGSSYYSSIYFPRLLLNKSANDEMEGR